MGGHQPLEVDEAENRNQVAHVQGVGRWVEPDVRGHGAAGEPLLQPVGHLVEHPAPAQLGEEIDRHVPPASFVGDR